MAIVVVGQFRMPAENMEQARPLMAKVMLATRAEDGCLDYSYAPDLLDPCLIRIAEKWESAEALAAHGQSAHMAAFNKAMGGVKREGAELWLYSAEIVRRIM